ncbi:putative dimethyl sulfoxide reductase [Candidatus Terasakiella magnetica]|uniref:Putative dimethyl sulfoxide reductase n=1 Tax=Candidatus Terasakiella magnetica TaxID=1867952 RepID=A0A1C3RD77_9PROT|nr:molybdopterin-dependent oxidoreductase [Candidatus Terasakiella magnetica]SCA55219.1 putative dimethyl sulfoxide reductase [Candidatus Terasakiella magnetica]
MCSEIVKSVCPHDCPSVCPLEVERLGPKRIGKVKGSPANAFTAGIICGKVARYSERIHHGQRLLYPMKRVGKKGSDNFKRITWDEALETVAKNLLRVEREHGAEAVWPFYYAGTMGHVMRDGINRLRHVKGYSGMQGTYCTALSGPGWEAGCGTKRGSDVLEMEKSDLIVIWGLNAVSSQIHLMTHVIKGIRNGAKLVVVDPYQNKTADKAHLHLPLRPGTDGALACAVMHVLFEEGYADKAYLEKYTDLPKEFEEHLKTKTPEWASEITGLAAHTIEAFARLYGSSKKTFLRVGHGMTRSRNGAHNMHAVSCLPAVTGAWQYEGGGALYGQGDLAQLDTTLIEGKDVKNPDVRMLDQSRIGEILTGHEGALKGGPEVKALFIQNTNPVAVAPDSSAVRKGFMRDDLFVCVHEQFMTETAKMADIVLPATMFLEHDDIYTASAHCTLQVAKSVISPAGACKSNHQVICELAKKLGAQHKGFDLSALAIVEETLKKSGYPNVADIIATTGHDLSLPFEEAHFLNGFAHPDGKFRFKPDWSSLGPRGETMPEFPDHWDVIDEVDKEKQFRLITPPSQNFLNSSFSETKTSRIKERCPEALINQRVMRKLGLVEGDLVRVGNELGSVLLNAVSAKNQHEDTVVVEGIWPNSSFLEGRGINTLVSSEPGYPNNGAVFHDTAVWLRAHK